MKILVCGKGGCGKSTVVALLAREIALRKSKVLVVDSDESNTGLHSRLGMNSLANLDLEPGRGRTQDRKWILDFNQAYNPWCVYSEAYTCPFVPPENCLEVPILAGEKNYPLK